MGCSGSKDPRTGAATTMTEPAVAGDTMLKVEANEGFEPGSEVMVGNEGDADYELVIVEGLLDSQDSLQLQALLQHPHEAGTTVKVLLPELPAGNEECAATTMTEPAAAGDTVLQVEANERFEPGTEAMVGNEGDADYELVVVESLGSLHLMAPLQHPHEAGTSIKALPAAVAEGDDEQEDDGDDMPMVQEEANQVSWPVLVCSLNQA